MSPETERPVFGVYWRRLTSVMFSILQHMETMSGAGARTQPDAGADITVLAGAAEPLPAPSRRF